MRELVDKTAGERMALSPYQADFNQRYWQIGEPGFWKLERLQKFRELGGASWDAFLRGDWDEAIRQHEARRPEHQARLRKIAEHGFGTHRVRVVEKPITPYLQWELHALRVRSQCGENICVVGMGHVERFEEHGVLPEIVTLGHEVTYELWYDETGLQQGGIRFDDPELTIRCQKFIADLYALGEDIESYFEREVAGLEPPPAP